MSLSLAKSWANATIIKPAALDDALRLLDQAAAEGCEATLIAGPQLVKNGKCFLGRWDGRELVLRELGRTEQQDWSIDPEGAVSTAGASCDTSGEVLVGAIGFFDSIACRMY